MTLANSIVVTDHDVVEQIGTAARFETMTVVMAPESATASPPPSQFQADPK